MPFQMKISKEAVEGKEVVPTGIYLVRFIEFKPKFSKPDPNNPQKQLTLNYNPKMEIVEGEYTGRFPGFENLNESCWYISDFVHCFGLPMEDTGDPDSPYMIPGIWDGEQGKAETYTYKGPLTGKVGKVEVAIDTYNGKQSNKIRRYFCAVDSCAQLYPNIKHSSDLLARSK